MNIVTPNTTIASELGTTLFGTDAVIGLAAGLAVLLMSMLLTWFCLRLTWVGWGARPRTAEDDEDERQQRRSRNDNNGSVNNNNNNNNANRFDGVPMKGEGWLLSDLRIFIIFTVGSAATYARGIGTSILDAFKDFVRNFLVIVILLLVSLIAIAYLYWHEILLVIFFRIWQCTVRPVLDYLIFPVLNILRVLFALFWPFVNVAREILTAVTTGNYRVIFDCLDKNLFVEIAEPLGNASKAFVTEFVDFLQYGLLYHGRLDIIPALVYIGESINATRAVANCYCIKLAPVWDLLYAIPQLPDLYVTIDCSVNVVVRFFQIPLNLIFNFELPNLTDYADELTCTTLGIGNVAEDISRLIVAFFYSVYQLISGLVASLSVEQRAPLFARVAAVHAMSESTLIIPASLARLRSTRGAVPLRSLAMVSLSAADQAIASAHGFRHKLFNIPTVDPNAPSASTKRFHASNVNAVNAWWDVLAGANLTLTLGFGALMRVTNTAWSRIFTAVPTTIIGVINITVNAAFSPVAAFASPKGIAYFQIGFLGDYTRAAVNALVELLAFFDSALPCTFSKSAQAFASIFESFWEFFIGSVFTWAWRPWKMGVPAPVDCDVVTCGQLPAPPGYYVLSVFPDYFNWNTSRMARNLQLLLEGGECTAFLLGCNTTADNNNSTNVTSLCLDAPLACTARSLNKASVSIINVTLAIIFYIPALFQFKPGLETFDDVPFAATQVAVEEFIFCLGLLIDRLDVFNNGTYDPTNPDYCLTPIPPDNPPTNPNVTLPPPGGPDPSIQVIPQRSLWECRIDGKAYFLDGEFVMVSNVTNPFNLTLYHYDCNILDSLNCNIAQTPNVSVQVLGSAPQDNVTLIITPRWIPVTSSIPFTVTFNATSGQVVTPPPNATSNPGYSNFSIVSSVIEDCTYTAPELPEALSDTYACGSDGYAMYLSQLYQFSLTRSNAYVGLAVPPSPSFLPSPSDASPSTSSPVPTPTPTPAPPPPPPGLGCSFNNAPEIYCDELPGFGPRVFVATPLGPREVLYLLTTQSPVLGRSLTCTNTSGPLPTTDFDWPINVICYQNGLNVLANGTAYPPPVTTNINNTMLFPIFFYNDPTVSTSGTRLGCENIPPPDYTCEPPNDSMASNGIILQAATVGGPVELPCTQNPLPFPPPPTCTRIRVNYTDGSSVAVELEGGEVRIYANDSIRLPLTCQAGSFSGSSVSSTTSASAHDDEVLALSSSAYDLRGVINHAQSHARINYLKRDSGMRAPVITASALNELVHANNDDELVYDPVAQFKIDRMLLYASDFSNTALYRKDSFICCLSTVVTASLTFLESTFYSIVFLLQSILTNIVYPTWPINVPTFAVARDNLRTALCKLACVITSALPFTLSCPNSAGGSCNTANVCSRNFLCDLFDIPVLIVDFIVNVLTLIKGLVANNPNDPPAPTIFGPYCQTFTGSLSECFVSFIAGIIIEYGGAFTMLLRSGAGTLDCYFCALARLVAGDIACPGVIYAVVNPLANLIDGIISSVLKPVLTFIIGLVQMVVYFFSGQLRLLITTFFNAVLGSISFFISNISTFIYEVLTNLPYVGPLFKVIFNVFSEACGIITDVIHTFGGPNIGCTSGKRTINDVPVFGWAITWNNVSNAWTTPSGGAYVACNARMAILNTTDFYVIDADPELSRELTYCYLAHLWVGDAATPDATSASNQVFVSECDYLMPSLYKQGLQWANISTDVKSRVGPCMESRYNAEKVRMTGNYATASWFPHDFFYKPMRVLQVLDEMWLAHDVYAQYVSDRSTGAAQLVSEQYRENWKVSGYDVSHLDGIVSSVRTAGEVYRMLDQNQGVFSLQSYADRSVATLSKTGARGKIGRTYDPLRIGALATQLWKPLLGMDKTDATENTTTTVTSATSTNDTTTLETIQSLGGSLVTYMFDSFEHYTDSMVLPFPLTSSTLTRITSTNNPRDLKQAMIGFMHVFTQDIPSLFVKLIRAPSRNTAFNEEASKKRAMQYPNELPAPSFGSYVVFVMQGAWQLASSYIAGAKDQSAAWLARPTTIAWLQEQVRLGHDWTAYTSAGTIALPHEQSLFSVGFSSMSNTISTYIGNAFSRTETMRQWKLLFDMSLDDTNFPVASSVIARRVTLSRLGATVALMSSIDPHDPHARTPYRAQETNNQTGLTCLFGVTRPANTSNSSSPSAATPTPIPTNNTNITYPLCQDCIGLDQLFGRISLAVLNTVYFFGVIPSNCTPNSTAFGCVPGAYTSIQYTLNQFRETQNYIYDPNATVIVGNSPALPVVYPYRTLDNWLYWEDPTPGKIGFSDFAALWNATICYLTKAYGATPTLDPHIIRVTAVRPEPDGSPGMVLQISSKLSPGEYGPIRGALQTTLFGALEMGIEYLFAPPETDQSTIVTTMITTMSSTGQFVVTANSTNGTCSTPFTSLSDVVEAWFGFFWDLRLCTDATGLDGSRKRYSIGQVFVVFLGILLLVSIVAAAFSESQLLLTIVIASTMTGLFLVLSFLVVTYDYSYTCFPALPVGLADDTMYFLVYSLLPKCLFGASIVNELTYDNTTCFACSRWADGNWTIPNFAEPNTQFNFVDLRYNIAFLLKNIFPNVYAALRPGSWLLDIPILGTFLKLPLIQDPLSKYANFSPDTVTDRQFAQFWQGATWVTLPANFVIAAAFFYIYYLLLWPLTLQVLNFLFTLVILLIPMLFVWFSGGFVVASFGLPAVIESAERRLERKTERKQQKRDQRKADEKRVERYLEEKNDRSQIGSTTTTTSSSISYQPRFMKSISIL